MIHFSFKKNKDCLCVIVNIVNITIMLRVLTSFIYLFITFLSLMYDLAMEMQ